MKLDHFLEIACLFESEVKFPFNLKLNSLESKTKFPIEMRQIHNPTVLLNTYQESAQNCCKRCDSFTTLVGRGLSLREIHQPMKCRRFSTQRQYQRRRKWTQGNFVPVPICFECWILKFIIFYKCGFFIFTGENGVNYKRVLRRIESLVYVSVGGRDSNRAINLILVYCDYTGTGGTTAEWTLLRKSRNLI